MKTVIIIPARLNSSRLKEKVLIDLNGKPMLQRVFERASQSNIKDIYIATDSQKVFDVASKFTEKIILTSVEHISGTDRISEAAEKIDCDYIINIQGDEPLIEPELINLLDKHLQEQKFCFITAAYPITSIEDIQDPNKVKVVFNREGQALYFSRSPIPYSKPLNLDSYCHIGIYGYTKDFLLKYTKLPPSKLEKMERLEQLRALEAGYPILVLVTKDKTFGIDTHEEIQKMLHFFVD